MRHCVFSRHAVALNFESEYFWCFFFKQKKHSSSVARCWVWATLRHHFSLFSVEKIFKYSIAYYFRFLTTKTSICFLNILYYFSNWLIVIDLLLLFVNLVFIHSLQASIYFFTRAFFYGAISRCRELEFLADGVWTDWPRCETTRSSRAKLVDERKVEICGNES